MCSQFNSSTLMFLSNSSTDCSFLSRPILDFQNGCQNSHSVDEKVTQNQEDQRQQDTRQEDDKKEEEDVKDSCLKVKEDEVLKIPTSPKCNTKQMICPPAPKKPKSIQITKRKQRVFLDVYDEVKSMFPPALLADLGNKIKKVRRESSIL
uniref:Uncharacterized protein LOC104224066 n=1 Tax=Nicotiana sylvestris TaxID=4096 RepID=A0A1U7W9N9_NICSY|nr:PREDICTED: uncharacterized protein LOC104224066 [Nicotiana sylvestris]